MKYATVLATLAGLVAAQDFTGQPDCAIPCLREHIPQVGCELSDTVCQCEPAKQAELLPRIQGCLLDNCDAGDLARAAAAARRVCEDLAATATGSDALSLSLPTNSAELSSLLNSLSGDVSSIIESITGSDSTTETGSATETMTETTETGSATETDESGSATSDEASATSSEGDNAAAATAAPIAGMAIAAILAAAL